MLFLPQCGQLKKHGKNKRKQKKTCFFLFLFCFLTVFLICTFVQNYNRTGRNFLLKAMTKGGKCMFLRISNNFVSNKVVTNKFITYLCNRKPISCVYGNGKSVRLWQGC